MTEFDIDDLVKRVKQAHVTKPNSDVIGHGLYLLAQHEQNLSQTALENLLADGIEIRHLNSVLYSLDANHAELSPRQEKSFDLVARYALQGLQDMEIRLANQSEVAVYQKIENRLVQLGLREEGDHDLSDAARTCWEQKPDAEAYFYA